MLKKSTEEFFSRHTKAGSILEKKAAESTAPEKWLYRGKVSVTIKAQYVSIMSSHILLAYTWLQRIKFALIIIKSFIEGYHVA